MAFDLLNKNSDAEAVPVHWDSERESPEVRASRRIRSILESGHPVINSWSAGKDSSVLVAITLSVAKDMVAAGQIGRASWRERV